MGKGDKKSRRGKIILGTYGVRRRRKDNSTHLPGSKDNQKETKSLSENIGAQGPPKEAKKPRQPVRTKPAVVKGSTPSEAKASKGKKT